MGILIDPEMVVCVFVFFMCTWLHVYRHDR